MLNNPTFNVSVIFGKRDEVSCLMIYEVDTTVTIHHIDLITEILDLQPMLVACARQLIEHIRSTFNPILNNKIGYGD